ncbi:iron-siderophore ABC transporter substrate-binding protein [Actinoplanes sp. NPDC051861]|uniref:iron-siderophore ABC transporter substrate-binding protein n=1 Tax=Actinoplanes sp. NPDC051861 TaxID=3155170 RepID=UPI00344786CA
MRRLTSALAAVVAVVTISACTNDNAGTAETGAPAASAGATDSFPITVEHKYGTAEIKAEPKRVVVAGLTEQDTLLALGIVPVATTEWFGEFPGAVWPWAQDELGSAAKPQVLTYVDGIQYEKIAGLRPDLIIGLYSALTQADYDTLSKIAPVVAQPKGGIDYGISWQDTVRTVSKSVGRSAAGEKIVADVEGKLAAAKRPEFAGKSALISTLYEGYYVYGSQDPRGRLLKDLGFTLPADLDALTGKEFGVSISKERTDLLDTDALVWLVPAYDADKAKIHADPLYAKLDVKTQGREVFLEDGELLGGATSFITPLSLPFLLDGLVPQLAAAVDGDPNTPVVRASQPAPAPSAS